MTIIHRPGLQGLDPLDDPISSVEDQVEEEPPDDATGHVEELLGDVVEQALLTQLSRPCRLEGAVLLRWGKLHARREDAGGYGEIR